MKCNNVNDTCKYDPNIWFLDLNNDDKYDECLFRTCGGFIISQNLMDNSTATLNNDMTAILVSGLVETWNFLYDIYDPVSNSIICTLYYDNNFQGSVLNNYSGGDNQTINNEEADEYFFSRLIGSLLLISKKKDIDVLSVMICNMEGIVLFNLPETSGWSEFIFDLYQQPTGMYFVRFITSDKVLMKKIIYIR